MARSVLKKHQQQQQHTTADSGADGDAGAATSACIGKFIERSVLGVRVEFDVPAARLRMTPTPAFGTS